MNESITVQEQRHKIWKIATIGSAVLCGTFLLIYWYLSDPFWISIIRLCAFIFFSGTVLGYLKLRDGPLRITLNSSDKLLLISYQKKGETVQEEQFERGSIKEIISTGSQQNLVNRFLQPNAAAFKISFTDSDRILYLFEFGGRPLLFDRPSQKKIKRFLQGREIDF